MTYGAVQLSLFHNDDTPLNVSGISMTKIIGLFLTLMSRLSHVDSRYLSLMISESRAYDLFTFISSTDAYIFGTCGIFSTRISDLLRIHGRRLLDDDSRLFTR